MTGTAFEPTATWFLNEHSAIWPNYFNASN